MFLGHKKKQADALLNILKRCNVSFKLQITSLVPRSNFEQVDEKRYTFFSMQRVIKTLLQ